MAIVALVVIVASVVEVIFLLFAIPVVKPHVYSNKHLFFVYT